MKTNMFYGASPILFELAKRLRNNVTPTEMILWGRMKEYFPELKFRRQHPIFLYIADFYCHSEKLIIEIDGNIHDLPEIKIIDAIRQKDLEELGIIIVRVSTTEVLNDIHSILKKIEKILNK